MEKQYIKTGTRIGSHMAWHIIFNINYTSKTLL